MMAATLILLYLVSTATVGHGFLFGGGGGGCSSCCPPPIPCNCMQQQQSACSQSYAPPPAQCSCAPRVYDGKTVTAQPLDELELRAQVSGIQLDKQPTLDSQITVPRQLELLERLGEYEQYRLSPNQLGPPRAQSYFSSPNVRFSPQDRSKDAISLVSTEDETPQKIDESTTTPKPPLSSGEHVAEDDQDIKCNSHVLKKLMFEKMNDNSALSKRQINKAAEAMFGGNIDVICSRSHFSYIYSSSLYCETSKGPTTCIAFRQTK